MTVAMPIRIASRAVCIGAVPFWINSLSTWSKNGLASHSSPGGIVTGVSCGIGYSPVPPLPVVGMEVNWTSQPPAGVATQPG